MKTIDGFCDWIKLQISSRGRPYSISTANGYKVYVNAVLRKTDSTIDTINKEKVEKFLSQYSCREENRNAGFASYNEYLASLRLFEKYIGREITTGLKFLKVSLPDIMNRKLSVIELGKLHKCPYLDLETLSLVTFLYDTGCRISEAMKITDKTINLSKGFAVLKGTKNGKDRSVVFSPETARIITLYQLSQGSNTDAIWGNHCYSSYSRKVKKAISMVCPEDLTGRFIGLHSLRHSRAFLLTLVGTSSIALIDQLGWSSMEMARRYVHLSLEDRQEMIKEGDKKIKARYKK